MHSGIPSIIRSIKVNCQIENLKKIRSFVESCLKDLPLSEVDINLIVLAIDEICSNKIIHSAKGNNNEELILNIKFEKSPAKILFEVIDFGISFDYSSYQEPRLEDLIDEKRKGSLGMMLVRKIMDKIEFESQDSQNICRLSKKISSTSAA